MIDLMEASFANGWLGVLWEAGYGDESLGISPLRCFAIEYACRSRLDVATLEFPLSRL